MMNSKRLTLFMAALCCIMNVPSIVEGRYFVEVGVFGYNNPTGRCQGCLRNGQRGCCDQFNTLTCNGNLQCDSYFSYCLSNEDEGGCASGSQRMTSEANENDGDINFTQSRVLGLENPFFLEGLTDNYSEVQVRVAVRDQDPERNNPDDLIDILLIDHNLPVGETSIVRNHSGIFSFNYVTMDLTVRVLCAPNFQGTDCSECDPGFTGDMCNENIDDCNGVSCSRNGVCEDGVDMFSCICDPDFTGKQCEINIDDCAAVNCSGLGQCMDLVNSFECVCVPGFTGQLCETNIDDCQMNSCSRQGQCRDEINTFTCDCENGFTGNSCEVNIDECVGEICSGNGECIDGVGSFTCNCNNGFTGSLCEVNIDDCGGVTCSGNGRCVDGIDSSLCLCDNGFTGENCEIDIDDCEGVNCSGNGECLDGVNSFACECSPSHSGPLCSEELRSSNSTGPIVGGVLGVVLSVILILALVMMLVLIMRCRNEEGKAIFAGRKTGDGQFGALPGDNPIYDQGDNAISLGVLPWTAVPIHYENLTATALERGCKPTVPDREFDNPIYGRNENGMYAYPHNYQAGVGMGLAPYHEFDNPIYGREIDDNTYSVISDSSLARGSMTTTSARENAYENEESPLTDSEQVYAHIN